MENNQSQLTGFYARILVVIGLTFLLAACQTVQMPNLPNFNLGPSAPEQFVTIKSHYNRVNIRPTPSTNQPPVGTLAGGDQVKMISEHNNWFNIVFYDTTGAEKAGWIYKYLVVGYDKPSSVQDSQQSYDSPQLENNDFEEEYEDPEEDISIL